MLNFGYNLVLLWLALFNVLWLIYNARAQSSAFLFTLGAICCHLFALYRIVAGFATLRLFMIHPDVMYAAVNSYLGIYWIGGAFPHYLKAIRYVHQRLAQRFRLRSLLRPDRS